MCLSWVEVYYCPGPDSVNNVRYIVFGFFCQPLVLDGYEGKKLIPNNVKWDLKKDSITILFFSSPCSLQEPNSHQVLESMVKYEKLSIKTLIIK